MKCEYCNGNLSLEDEYCPHCGKPNKHARKHIDDMRRFQGEFEDTRKYVRDKTIGYTEITVRVVILSILIVLILVFFAVGANAWEINREIKKKSAEKKFEEYSGASTRVFKETKAYQIGDVWFYPCICHDKHSKVNALGWLKNQQDRERDFYHIGIAHGAIEGLSYDRNQEYYYSGISNRSYNE